MKKLFLASMAMCIVLLSQAQIKKGTTFIGGNIGFSQQTTGTNDTTYAYTPKITSFSFTPTIGWAVKDNLVFGIDLGYGYQKSDNTQNAGPSLVNYYKVNSFKGGVYLRKYKPLGSGFSLFGQVNLDYNYSNSDNYSSATTYSKQKGSGVGLTFSPGVAYTINRHWQIEAGLGNFASINYNHVRSTILSSNFPDQHYTTDNFNAGTSFGGYFQFQAGLLYIM